MSKRKKSKSSKMYRGLVEAKHNKLPQEPDHTGDSPTESVKSMYSYLDSRCSKCDEPLVADATESAKAMLSALLERLRSEGVSLDELEAIA